MKKWNILDAMAKAQNCILGILQQCCLVRQFKRVITCPGNKLVIRRSVMTWRQFFPIPFSMQPAFSAFPVFLTSQTDLSNWGQANACWEPYLQNRNEQKQADETRRRICDISDVKFKNYKFAFRSHAPRIRLCFCRALTLRPCQTCFPTN